MRRRRLCLQLTKGQWDLLKDLLYNDSQLNEFNGLASRAIYEAIERAEQSQQTPD